MIRRWFSLFAVLGAVAVAVPALAGSETPPPTEPIPCPPASANAPAPVYCGTFTCFYIKAGAGAKDQTARALAAMDIINKYLGGKYGKVTIKPSGKNFRLLLNNEIVAIVTPADATAEKHKTVATLAERWRKQLDTAFQATKAVP
jgi:hypothetical protein